MRTELLNNDELLQQAKETAVVLVSGQVDALELLNSTNLEEIENGIKKLNEYTEKCWLLSSIVLYTMVYDKNLYEQSGLSWVEYLAQSRSRLNMDKRDVTEQLSSARFFIKNHKKLVEAGWKPSGSSRKMARAELALELSGDLDLTIQHLANDTWKDFNDWYSGYRVRVLMESPSPIKEIEIRKNEFLIGGKIAVTISDDLDEEDRLKLQVYLNKIFTAMKNGEEPMFTEISEIKDAQRLQHDKK